MLASRVPSSNAYLLSWFLYKTRFVDIPACVLRADAYAVQRATKVPGTGSRTLRASIFLLGAPGRVSRLWRWGEGCECCDGGSVPGMRNNRGDAAGRQTARVYPFHPSGRVWACGLRGCRCSVVGATGAVAHSGAVACVSGMLTVNADTSRVHDRICAAADRRGLPIWARDAAQSKNTSCVG